MSAPLEADLRYWKARAEALEASLERLRARALSQPSAMLRVTAEGGSAGPAWSVLDGWEDSDAVRPADVETELEAAWERLGSGSRVG